MDFTKRRQRGLLALERARRLFESWGFSVSDNGCEFQLSETELSELRGDPDELTPEQRRLRYSPDLRITGYVEVKFTRSLDELSFSVREWLQHRRLAHVVYCFVSSDGSYKLIPVGKLKPDRIFYVHDRDLEWLRRELPDPDVPLIKLQRCNGSGDPFAVMSLR